MFDVLPFASCFSGNSITACCVLLAFLLDYFLGEPKQYHPLVGFGRWAKFVELRLNNTAVSQSTGIKGESNAKQRLRGVAAYVLVVAPILCVAIWFEVVFRTIEWLYFLVASLLVYLCIGWQSLLLHAQAIRKPLADGNLDFARKALAMIVSRDTAALQETDIAKAATESILENGADAIFSALFWFFLLGMPGVVLYRMSNTLDAMWGYKTARFFNFGWCAARVDDVLNFVPARLCALSYCILGHFLLAIRCWWMQGSKWKSPNAGPVMAAGAGALNVSLGGGAIYHGQLQYRPTLGPDETHNTMAKAASIGRACALVNKTVLLWCVLIASIGWLW